MCFIKDSWRYETSGLTLLKFGDKIKRRLYLFFTSNKKYPCSTIQQEQLLRRFTEWMENGSCSAAALLFFFVVKVGCERPLDPRPTIKDWREAWFILFCCYILFFHSFIYLSTTIAAALAVAAVNPSTLVTCRWIIFTKGTDQLLLEPCKFYHGSKYLLF